MNRPDMLAVLGLSDSEFTDMLQKFNAFLNTLNANQRAVIQNSVPSVSQAAASFGPDVSTADVQYLVSEGMDDSETTTVMFFALAAGK